MHGPNKRSKNRESEKFSQLHTAKGKKLSVQLRSKKKGKNFTGRQSVLKIKCCRKGNDTNLSAEAKKKFMHEKIDKRSNKKEQPAVIVQHEKSSLVQNEVKDADGEVSLNKLQKRKRRKKKKNGKNENVEQDEPSRMQRRVRYLLIKMKLEQNLIDAYSAEGWKGQSREKIRPEKELQRARKQIWKCKLGLRDAIRQLDSLSRVGSIENSVIAPDGSVYHEHIFCAKCKQNEAFPDNDIILCDGTCNCAFHQKCLDPPLATEQIPPGDQGWFCKFCECKIEILETINAHLGTHFSGNSAWQDIFKEEAAFPDGSHALLNTEEDWPSDDSEDDDYDPDRRERGHGTGVGSEDISSDNEISSTSFWSANDDYTSGTEDIVHEAVSLGRCTESGDSTDGEVLNGRRQRRAVDYKKLHDEMFGKDATVHEQVSEDEDWGPKKKKRKQKDSDADCTLITLCERKDENPENSPHEGMNETSNMDFKRSLFRIPRDAVEKLRQVFQVNQLPPRSVKENLSLQLGLDPEKVSKWFKNARYLALKAAKKKEDESIHLNNFVPSSKSRDTELDAMKQSNPVTVIDIPEKTLTSVPKHKKICGKQIKSSSSTKPVSAEKVNQVVHDHNDDVSLKKLLRMKQMEKRISSKLDSRATEIEFERLSEAKQRLQCMKQRIAAAVQHSHNIESSNDYLNHRRHVIFVPVAELKEKAC